MVVKFIRHFRLADGNTFMKGTFATFKDAKQVGNKIIVKDFILIVGKDVIKIS